MYRNSIFKQIIFFIIGSLINLAMFCLSKYAGFPVWADFAGSVYITALGGPVWGLISIIVHTVLLILFIDGNYAIWFALPAVLICAVVYLFKIKEISFSFKNICAVGCISSLITFLCTWIAFVAVGAWGRRLVIAQMITTGYLQCVIAAGLALLEACLTVAVFYISFLLTPKNDDKLIFKR